MSAGRRGFTLPELLMSISILALVAATLIVALARVREDAREARTKSQIAKINQLLMSRWESYQTRAIPLRIDYRSAPSGTAQNVYVQQVRLNAIRDLMRMELPDRVSDVADGPVDVDPTALTLTLARPSLSLGYVRRVNASGGFSNWTRQYQGAECLYMILASMQDGNGNGLAFFKQSEIGDVDGDQMNEILDAWGRPIEFVRWPAGLRSTIQQGDTQASTDGDAGNAPDPFDPFRADARWNDSVADNDPFAMFPLVFSPGQDRIYDVVTDKPAPEPPLRYSTTSPANDPYHIPLDGSGNPLPQMGSRSDVNGDGRQQFADNLDNHFGLNE